MSRRASQQLLDSLHGRVSKNIMAQLDSYERGEIIDNKTGQPMLAPATLIDKALTLLKMSNTDRASNERGGEYATADSLAAWLTRTTETPNVKAEVESITETPVQIKKRCPSHNDGAGAWLPVSEFNANAARYDGLAPICKSCRKARKQ